MFKLKISSNEIICNSTAELLSSIFIPDNKPVLILVRGLPGCGKSTLSKAICEKFNNISHFEADMFFQKEHVYFFDKTKLKNAHEWCFNQTTASLSKGSSVCVANTFVKKWEMQKFIRAAESFKVDLLIIECLDEYDSIHSVPKETIERMRKQWESL